MSQTKVRRGMGETLRAAYVVARRDFMAIIGSKAFFFFLLGPLFPVMVALAAGSIGGAARDDLGPPVVGVAMSDADFAKINATRDRLSQSMEAVQQPEFKRLEPADTKNVEAVLGDPKRGLAAILAGTVESPRLYGTEGLSPALQDKLALAIALTRDKDAPTIAPIPLTRFGSSADSLKSARLITAQAAQALLFLLTMLLAGMVLSNMVEEKSNKVIEILAAAIPLDSVFLGKLFAMLAMAFIGIVIWGISGFAIATAVGQEIPQLPSPAVGWPAFIALGVAYFAMAYLILGAIFVGIGSLASSVREVQTLSMPVTMSQMMIFFFALYTVGKMGEPVEIAASVFPLSSPFAMMARAAQDDRLWIHGVALVGQAFFVLLTLRVGVILFRQNVMKSRSGGPKGRRGLKAAISGLQSAISARN